MRRVHLPLAVLATAFAFSSSASAGNAATTCDRVAAPGGNDAAAGTAAAPLRTATRLAASLRPGQTGCLRTGEYREAVALGTDDITLTSYPGDVATLIGRLWVKDGADGVTVSGLKLDGTNPTDLPSPTVNGDGAQFIANDVTNHDTAICFNLGSFTYGRATGTVIRQNRIHRCGRRPADNHEHGIYVTAADDTQIVDNVIYDNADRGIQLYPDAQRTTIQGNVIDGNGQGIIFSGADGRTSNGNRVIGNVITNATIRSNVESYYPAGNPRGSDNLVRGNCISGGARYDVDTRGGGFDASDNIVGRNPDYVSAKAGDFRMAANSPCAALMAASRAPAASFAALAADDATVPNPPACGCATTPAGPAPSAPAAPTTPAPAATVAPSAPVAAQPVPVAAVVTAVPLPAQGTPAVVIAAAGPSAHLTTTVAVSGRRTPTATPAQLLRAARKAARRACPGRSRAQRACQRRALRRAMRHARATAGR